MDAGDVVGLVEGLLMAGTWALVLHRKLVFENWRRKLALAALVCPTVAIAADLVLTAVMHFHSPDAFVAQFWGWVVIGSLVLGMCGFALAIFSKGRPRLAAALWSSWALISAIYNIIAATRS